MYQGLRLFRTDSPAMLGQDLQRQNTELERVFGEIDRDKLSRWNVRRSTAGSVGAAHGDMVLAGFNKNATVLLPASSPEKAGHAVRVVQVGGLGAITVLAQFGETVNTVSSVTMGVNIGFREYVDDGAGGWWGPAT
jgi:hypothetical protein